MQYNNNISENKDLQSALQDSNATKYVRYWLLQRRLKYEKNGLWRSGRDQLKTSQLQNLLTVDYQRDSREFSKAVQKVNETLPNYQKQSFKSHPQKVMDAALENVIEEKKKELLDEVRESVKHNGMPDKAVMLCRTFTENITTINVELAMAVMLNFIWLVKRRLYGLSVDNQIVPVITGGQGKGKSRNVDRFLSPLQTLRLDIHDAAHLTDARMYHAYADNYVGSMDELARLDKADFNNIKNFITALVLSSRTLGTHSTSSTPNNISLIGTSNHRLKHQIFDHTGMRRFFELVVDKEISQEISESVDYLLMWQGVDENAPSPLEPFKKELADHQEELRNQDYAEMFMSEMLVDMSKQCIVKVEVRNGLYRRFREWATEIGVASPKIMSEPVMKNMFEARGLKQTTIDGKKWYKVNEDCRLNPEYEQVNVVLSTTDEVDLSQLPGLEHDLLRLVKSGDYNTALKYLSMILRIKRKQKNDVFSLL